MIIVVISVVMMFLNYKKNHNYLELYGNVDIRQVDLGFRVSGRLQKMLVEEGDQVKQGDLLAVLDKAPYEADLASAKAALAQAEANYLKLQHGSRPQEIEEARALVHEKQASLTNADLIFARQQEQIKIGASSQQNYDDAFAQKNEAEAQLKSAQESLDLAEEGFRQEDIQAGKAAMEVAKAQLESAKINLTDTEICSPSDGIILTRVREPGAIIAPQSIIYTLTLHKPVWIRAYVSETDLGSIKPGMEALIYTDADPDNPFKAKIGFISPTAEFTPKTVETPELRTDLVYRLRLYVDDPKGKLRQGMPVTVELDVKE
ncbi:MAG: secretion protein HlyD [Alphaproteobacteria bacterium]|nr:secretion protein HlyD [Alphaproteobacteria bacterium]